MPDMPAGTLEIDRPVPGIVPPVFRSKGFRIPEAIFDMLEAKAK